MFNQVSPFNLGQTMTDSVSALFNDGLERLIDRAFLAETANVDGIPRPINHKYHFDFNHEQGTWFSQNKFERLILRYLPRIDGLKSILSGSVNVFVHYTERDGDLKNLTDSIRKSANGGDFRIVILDAWEGPRSGIPSQRDIIYQKVRLPRPGYVWHRPDDFDSDDGIEFERELQDIILKAIIDLSGGETCTAPPNY
jgi:hypothetical protein